MKPKLDNYQDHVERLFTAANFVRLLDIELGEVGPGWCTAHIDVHEKHLQQDGFIHAGVVATLADHTAGASAGSLMGADEIPLTVEFKVNLLRPGIGQRLRCRAEVLKAGKRLTVAESSVWAEHHGKEKLIGKAMVTLANVERPA